MTDGASYLQKRLGTIARFRKTYAYHYQISQNARDEPLQGSNHIPNFPISDLYNKLHYKLLRRLMIQVLLVIANLIFLMIIMIYEDKLIEKCRKCLQVAQHESSF